jgi:hypothetical protein
MYRNTKIDELHIKDDHSEQSLTSKVSSFEVPYIKGAYIPGIKRSLCTFFLRYNL